ncbi:MAG TPA: hypothetical protein VLK35_12245 [Methylomirabilota bacterium]|nr:hypothetical protein [Methylomirabilota bacterium]
MAVVPARTLRIGLQSHWDPPTADRGHQGLLAWDPRVRTLVRVLVSYPEVRYVLPDRISLDPGADPRTIETMARFLERQGWLVRRVAVS